MSAARFADPALVYNRHKRATPLAPADSALSTSMARFVDPALVYHLREGATPSTPDALSVGTEPLMYHPVAIHCDPGHVHPILTRCTASILRLTDRLILATDTTATSPDASPVLSFVRAALANLHWCHAMEEEHAALLANHTWDLVLHPLGIWSAG